MADAHGMAVRWRLIADAVSRLMDMAALNGRSNIEHLDARDRETLAGFVVAVATIEAASLRGEALSEAVTQACANRINAAVDLAQTSGRAAEAEQRSAGIDVDGCDLRRRRLLRDVLRLAWVASQR